YEEGRAEIADTVTKTWGKHTLSFGGDFNHVNTTESFPLFYPLEADFGSLSAFLGDQKDFVSQIAGRPTPHPFVIFFERFDAACGFNEPSFSTSVYREARFLLRFGTKPKVSWSTPTKVSSFRTSGAPTPT